MGLDQDHPQITKIPLPYDEGSMKEVDGLTSSSLIQSFNEECPHV